LGVGVGDGVAVGVGESVGVGVGESVGVGHWPVPTGVQVDVGVGDGVGDGVTMNTGTEFENSEVLLDGSVAVAVTVEASKEASRKSALMPALPLPFVVTGMDPTKVRPSSEPFLKNSI
jgi:hypothetical protein